MPLIASATLAYAAGLLTGFGGAFVWTGAAALFVVWRGARSLRERMALLAIVTAGIATAVATRATDIDCSARLQQATVLDLVLGADATPGAFIPARHDCGVAVRLSVASGQAAAGARVQVRGRVSQSRGGLLVERAVVRPVRAAGLLARWRTALGEGIDRHFREDAPLVRALLIADMQELSPTLRQKFAAAGLSHMLSVSGLHVGLIAMAVALLAQLGGLSRTRSNAVVVALTTVYVAMIGAPLPAVRAAAMLAAVALSHTVQRPTSAWAILAIGALLPLADARAVLDVGYQLSVVGIVALIAAGALGKRWPWLGQAGARGSLYRALVASIAATLLTAPLVASTFGRVSIIAPVTNLAAVPIVAALQPMLFLALLLFPAGVLAQFVADACHPLIAAIDWIATHAAGFPGASIAVIPDPMTTALASAAGAAFVVAAMSRHPGRWLVAGTMSGAIMAWRPLLPNRAAATELHMIDVGQGDAIALRSTRGRWVLFDAGRDWQGGDEGQRDVIPYLAARGGTLSAFVLSHPHSDHVGGAASTLRALRPTWYFDPGYAGATTPYRTSLDEARRGGIRWRRVSPGDSLVIDEAVITFLAPDSAWAAGQTDPNLASAIARIRIGTVTILMTGDAEAPEERWLLSHRPELLLADVLKVAHHGSRTSSTDAFLDAVRPRLALVSVGAGNMYHHPSPEIMESLAAHGAIVMRTDRHGSIVVRTDGQSIEIESAGERFALRPR